MVAQMSQADKLSTPNAHQMLWPPDVSCWDICHISWDRVCLWLHPLAPRPEPESSAVACKCSTGTRSGRRRWVHSWLLSPPWPTTQTIGPFPWTASVPRRSGDPRASYCTSKRDNADLSESCGEDRNGTRDAIYDIYFIRIRIWIKHDIYG